MPEQIKFSLLENAFDYLLSASEHQAANTARDNKYAVLHLVAGIELLLKARLHYEHWTLLFNDVDKANLSARGRGDFKGIDFDIAIKRLTEVVGIKFDSRNLENLRLLRDVRNKIQHFAIAIDVDTLKSLLAIGYNFALDFYGEEIQELARRANEDISGELLQNIKDKLNEFAEFVRQRMEILRPDLASAIKVISCPICTQDAMVLGDGRPHCLYCNISSSAEELADLLFWNDTTFRIVECPHCGTETCVSQTEFGKVTGFCTSCGEEGTYYKCSRCGRPIVDYHDDPCPRCKDEMKEESEYEEEMQKDRESDPW